MSLTNDEMLANVDQMATLLTATCDMYTQDDMAKELTEVHDAMLKFTGELGYTPDELELPHIP